MADDDIEPLRGSGARELVPAGGLPFTENGRPRPAVRDITALPTKEAMALVRWDYDPLKEEIVTGKMQVGLFFENFEWSDPSY